MPPRPIRPLPPILRRLLLGVALGALLGACASPQGPGETPGATGHLYLWEVSHPDPAVAGGHLFGTFHVGDGGALDPAVRQALAEAHTLALELAPDDTTPARAASALILRGRLAPGQTLRDVLPPETFAALEARFAGREIEWQGLQHMKPWVTLFQLVSEVYADSGFSGAGGAEALLLGDGDAAHSVVGLETVEEQIAVFDGLSLRSQVRAIQDLLAEGDEAASTVEALMRAWREGDDATLERLSFAGADDPDMAGFYDALYFDRNEVMSVRIDALLRQGAPTFVGVGAAHMLGEHGLPALLGERGYVLRRVPRTPPASLGAP